MTYSVLSDDHKSDLKRDGFVILKEAVPKEITSKAKALINQDPTRIVYGDSDRINDLYNKSSLRKLMLEVMGEHTAPINAQVAVTLPNYSDAVVRRKATDVFHPQAHVDGGWAGLCPQKTSEILESGQTLETWGSEGDPKSMGPAGGAPLWQDQARTVAIGSYTALVGVCLNDQMEPAKGQFSVRRGAHEAVEKFFCHQRRKGGPIGGGGPDWPRLQPIGEDSAFAGIMPPKMVESYPATRFEMDGWPWPELTPVRMQEGDAVIALHSLPHTATPNMSEDPRMNVFFRIRKYRSQNPYEGNHRIGWGVSDHPDRALNGDFLAYPDGYDPFATSVQKMCDHWCEWDGMSHIVDEQPELAELVIQA
ncbi:MAG: hypothetical protein OXG24_08760 [Gammaproteobacteria bacterium]|nr:hypothetical protein [Gammaproteobacteria bacterium]